VKTPVRWLEQGSDAPGGARELLAAAAPTPEFSDAIRYRLAVGVAKTATLPAAASWGSVLAKGALVVALGGASGFAVHTWAGAHPTPVPLPVQVAPATPAAAPRSDSQGPPPVSIDQLPALQLPAAPVEPAPRLKLDPRLEEAELLEKARALVGSSPAAALKLTAEHTRDFPKGRLGAEADLIAAQALLGMGKAAAAKQRAQASLQRYPNGIYARQLREIIDAL
jgi:hypothetical protein